MSDKQVCNHLIGVWTDFDNGRAIRKYKYRDTQNSGLTPLRKEFAISFDYCPDCGTKINWDSIYCDHAIGYATGRHGQKVLYRVSECADFWNAFDPVNGDELYLECAFCDRRIDHPQRVLNRVSKRKLQSARIANFVRRKMRDFRRYLYVRYG